MTGIPVPRDPIKRKLTVWKHITAHADCLPQDSPGGRHKIELTRLTRTIDGGTPEPNRPRAAMRRSRDRVLSLILLALEAVEFRRVALPLFGERAELVLHVFEPLVGGGEIRLGRGIEKHA